MDLSKIETSVHQTIERTSEPEIVTEFYVNNARFVVISGDSYEDKSDVSAFSDLKINEQALAQTILHRAKTKPDPIAGQFQSEGITYTIVKQKDTVEKDTLDLANILTNRELQIATLVARGKSNKQIAKQLQISKWTVSTHLRKIFIKLKVDNRAAMVYSCFHVL